MNQKPALTPVALPPVPLRRSHNQGSPEPRQLPMREAWLCDLSVTLSLSCGNSVAIKRVALILY